MADESQLKILKQGPEVWNDWRTQARVSPVDLSRTDLGGFDLSGFNLSGANLTLTDLNRATLTAADLNRANLTGADLIAADLSAANLTGTDFRRASLLVAKLIGTDLVGADFSMAGMGNTILADLDMRGCKGLKLISHLGPSSLDIRTLQRSGPLPLAFLRGVGLPDALIEYLPKLLNQAIQFYSCFISYSTKDQPFADRLYADLQDKGVRCWVAPHDLPIGAKTWDAIDEAIRLRDKLLLILSEASIASDWVEDEVSKAYAEERDRKTTMLFPIRIDDVVMATVEPWARKLRDQRNIGDFRNWKDRDAYQKGFDRLLRDLRIKAA